MISLGATAPYRLWVDGVEIGEGPGGRWPALDARRWPIAFASGRHRVVIALCPGEDEGEVIARLTDEAGRGWPQGPISGPISGPLAGLTPPRGPVAASDPLAVATARWRAAPDDAPLALARARWATVVGLDVIPAWREALRRASGAPWQAEAQAALAHAGVGAARREALARWAAGVEVGGEAAGALAPWAQRHLGAYAAAAGLGFAAAGEGCGPGQVTCAAPRQRVIGEGPAPEEPAVADPCVEFEAKAGVARWALRVDASGRPTWCSRGDQARPPARRQRLRWGRALSALITLDPRQPALVEIIAPADLPLTVSALRRGGPAQISASAFTAGRRRWRIEAAPGEIQAVAISTTPSWAVVQRLRRGWRGLVDEAAEAALAGLVLPKAKTLDQLAGQIQRTLRCDGEADGPLGHISVAEALSGAAGGPWACATAALAMAERLAPDLEITAEILAPLPTGPDPQIPALFDQLGSPVVRWRVGDEVRWLGPDGTPSAPLSEDAVRFTLNGAPAYWQAPTAEGEVEMRWQITPEGAAVIRWRAELPPTLAACWPSRAAIEAYARRRWPEARALEGDGLAGAISLPAGGEVLLPVWIFPLNLSKRSAWRVRVIGEVEGARQIRPSSAGPGAALSVTRRADRWAVEATVEAGDALTEARLAVTPRGEDLQ